MSDAHSETQSRKHPFHLVDPSPWPVIGSVSAFVLALGAIRLMHDQSSWLFLLGVLLVLFTMAGWWRDVIREGHKDHHHTPKVRIGLREGMVLFIASEVMFFVAFFWAFFHSSLISPTVPQWPPEGIETFHTWGLPFINTLILLSSGGTVMWASHGIKEGNNRTAVIGLALTVLLGAIFLGVQAYEYGSAAFGFTEGIYPSVFYMATGFHGFHVFVGVVFLAVCLVRAARGHFRPDHHVGFQAAEWYWHFVDVVWLFLFVWIYWWGA